MASEKSKYEEYKEMQLECKYVISARAYGTLIMHLKEIKNTWYRLHWDTSKVTTEQLKNELEYIRKQLEYIDVLLAADIFDD